MCGVSGIWAVGWGGAELNEAVSAMSDTLRHRGPDDSGVWCDPAAGIALGHRRLSIIDLSAGGRQPMVGPSGTTRIVFNGEIYNYREVRDTLVAEGVRFRTASDTEVILALYEKYGEACVQSLRGMFAFGIWDAFRRRLVLARDGVGKKPLYYAASSDRLIFASEIKALRPVADPSQLELDKDSLNRYLSHGFISGPRTAYRGVVQLPPGSMLVASAPDRTTVTRYWTAASQAVSRPENRRTADVVEELEAKLANAVRLRLRADVPVAAFLSGGIDSGIVTALATRELGGPCSTFTVGFDDGQLDERPLARLVALRYGTDHHEVALHPDVASLLPAIARAYDQPFADASAIPSFCVAQFVSQHGIKVVLNGDGGDELFGGYRRAVAAAWLSKAHTAIGARKTAALAGTIRRMIPEPRAHRSAYAFGHRFLRGAAADETRRLLVWSTDSFSDDERAELGLEAYDAHRDEDGIRSYLPKGNGRSPLDNVLALDLNWMLPYDLLVKMDIATMAHGVEARSPLLDHEIIEWAVQLPHDIRLPGFATKPILRALARKYLPAQVATAPKRGFEPPVYRWLTHELAAMRDDLLLAPNGLVATMTDRTRLERFVRRPPSGDPDRWARQAWILLMLAAWDHFVTGDGRTATAGYVASTC